MPKETLPMDAAESAVDPASTMFMRLYSDLRVIAARQLHRLPPGQTLHPTEVVHEAYSRLVTSGDWESDAHFLNTAAQAMRQLLVDRARRRMAAKRGGGLRRQPAEAIDEFLVVEQSDEYIVQVHEALGELKSVDPRAAKLVELTFFLGLSQVEAAAVVGVSERTVRRDLIYAQAWLAQKLGSFADGDRDNAEKLP